MPVKDKMIKWALSSVLVMNAVDAIASLIFIKHLAVLEEANPVANLLMTLGDVPFVILKTLIVSMGVYILWENRTKSLALLGSYVAFVSYMALMTGFYLFLS
jgi:hypothetical protein